MPERRRRLRGRLVVAAVSVAVIAGSGSFLQLRLGPRELPRGRPGLPPTGSWFCPHGGGDGWSGWVAIANPGTGGVTVRATTFDERGITATSTFQVPPDRQVYREVPAVDPGSATQVEYFGGWVGASAVVTSGGAEPGAAAERCVPAPRSTWYLPDEPTDRGETAYVVVMNPFAETAQFDVRVRTERRSLRPGPLAPYVIPPRSSVGIRLNRFALQGAGERTVTAVVTARSGRVVAGGVVVTATGIRGEAGLAAPATASAIPAAGFEGPADLVVANPGGSRSTLAVISQGTSSQRVASNADGISVPEEGVRTIRIEGLDGSASVVSTNDRPIAATLRLTGSTGDLASLTGASAAPRWLVLPGTPPDGGRSFLIVQNPGREAATITIRLIGPGGIVAAPGLASRVVQPGRIYLLELSRAVGSDPLSVVVLASEGSVVAGTAAYPKVGGYAATLGVTIPALAGQV